MLIFEEGVVINANIDGLDVAVHKEVKSAQIIQLDDLCGINETPIVRK